MKYLNPSGDTIVEVLVAIAIASSVIASAFVVTNRAYQNSRQSQEHVEALKVLETQIEQLRALAGSSDINGDLFTKDGFCLSNNGSGTITVETVPSNCQLPSKGGYTYDVSIGKYDPVSGNFIAKVAWNGPAGIREHEEIAYKDFPGR